MILIVLVNGCSDKSITPDRGEAAPAVSSSFPIAGGGIGGAVPADSVVGGNDAPYVSSTVLGPEALGGDPLAVGIGPDGRYYVAIRTQRQLRVFDPDNGTTRTVSYEPQWGQTFPASLGWVADTLWLSNWPERGEPTAVLLLNAELQSLRRFDIAPLERDGLRATPLPRPLPGGRVLRRTTITAGRLIHDPPFVEAAEADPAWFVHREDLPIWLSDAEGLGARPIAQLPLRNSRAGFVSHTRMRTTVSHTFASNPLAAVSRTSEDIVVLERDVGLDPAEHGYTLRWISHRGDTLSVIRHRTAPVELSPDMREAELRRVAEVLRLEIPRDSLARLIAFLPRYLPAASSVVAGTDGWAWVAREARPGLAEQEWDIVNRTTGVVRSVSLPSRYRVRAVGGLIALARVEDDGGLTSVVRIEVRE